MLKEFDTIRLSNDDFPLQTSEENVIRGFTIVIPKGLYGSQGQNVTLVADTIVFDTDALLDTSGRDADRPVPPPATPGNGPRHDGLDGANGKDGGSITLVARSIQGTVHCNTKGGNGGQGQSGEDGVETNVFGGKAGKPGRSGNGGNITVILFTDRHQDPKKPRPMPTAADLKLTMGGGAAAAPAMSGSTHAYSSMEPVEPNRWGPDGELIEHRVDHPARPGVPGPGGHAGSDGRLLFFKDDPSQDYSTYCSTNQMRRVLAAAEEQYINQNLETVAGRLAWLCSLTKAVPDSAAAPIEQLDATFVGSNIDDLYDGLPNSFAGLFSRASTLLVQLINRFSYFGFPNDFVTFYDFDLLQNNITNMMDNAEKAEVAFKNWLNDFTLASAQNSAVSQAIATAYATDQQLKSQLDPLYGQASAMMGVIAQLRLECEAQEVLVNSLGVDFQAAVAEATGGDCTLLQVLEIAGAIVALVAAVYTAGESIIAAEALMATAVEEGIVLATVVKEIVPIVKATEQAIADVKDVNEKYKKLQAELAAARDSARIQMTEADVITLETKFYTAVDGAPVDQALKDRFKGAAHRYLELTNVRNHKIAEYDSIVLTIVNNYVAQANLVVLIDALNKRKEAAANPVKKECAEFIRSTLASHREMLRFLVWTERRALAFWTARVISLDYLRTELHISSAASVAAIRATHTQILGEYTAAKAFDSVAVRPLPAGQKVTIMLSESDRIRLKSSGQFSFSITFDQLDPMYRVLAQKLFIEFKGAQAFYGTLVHSGMHNIHLGPIVAGGFGTSRKYSTYPLRFLVERTPADPVDEVPLTLGAFGDRSRLGISPYTEWLLVLNPERASDVDNLTSIVLTFEGLCSA